ncbi:MAG: FHA domain-containing protein [Myxococcota bacterium]
MSTVTIAPHLQRALEAMSKDMAVDPQALVNQAVFAWLRINGYVTPGQPVAVTAPVAPASVVAAVPPVEAAPVAPPAPLPEPAPRVVSSPTPAPVAAPAPVPVPPVAPPVAAPEAKVAPTPAPDTRAARARMAEIAADLEKLTRPWPEWVQAEEEEEEQEDEAQDEAEDEAPSDELGEPEADAGEEEADESLLPPADEDEGGEELRDAAPPAEEPDLEANTGETEVAGADAEEPPPEEEPPAESTVVLRSVPIVLYLEREGEEPVRITAERFIIGRGPQCDLIIDSPRVSREHLAVTRQGIRYFIEDLNSSNGTWIGEERVTSRELESGDVINLGNEPVTFWLRGE